MRKGRRGDGMRKGMEGHGRAWKGMEGHGRAWNEEGGMCVLQARGKLLRSVRDQSRYIDLPLGDERGYPMTFHDLA